MHNNGNECLTEGRSRAGLGEVQGWEEHQVPSRREAQKGAKKILKTSVLSSKLYSGPVLAEEKNNSFSSFSGIKPKPLGLYF